MNNARKNAGAWMPHFFVFVFCTLFFWQHIYLSHSQILNHYPFISPDGYEWYTNGLYLLERAWPQDIGLPIIPVLRPPVYVALNALDFLFHESGLVLGFVQALSIFFTYYFCVILYRKFRPHADKESSIALWCLALGFTLMPINFFKPYLLSDAFAVCLSIGSVVLLTNYFKDQKTSSLTLASIVATVAALTQTYGYIPFCIFLSLFAISTYSSSSSKNALKHFLALALPLTTFIIANYLWRQSLPHLMTPHNFLWLSFSLKNLSFYQLIWPLYFWPILLSIAVALIMDVKGAYRWLFSGPIALYLVVLIFAAFCFFYQWKESRFTYYFWPWVLILFLSILPRLRGALKSIPLALFIASIFLFPINPWDPSTQNINLSYRNWAYQYFTSKPINRNLNQCVPRCPINALCEPSCEENEYFHDFSPHGISKTLSTYLFLRQLSN